MRYDGDGANLRHVQAVAAKHNIYVERCPPRTPQLIGHVESVQPILKNQLYTYLEQAGLLTGEGQGLWLESLRYAAEVHNSNTSVGASASRVELFKRLPKNKLEVPRYLALGAKWGSAMVAYHSKRAKNFARNGVVGIFVGFSTNMPYEALRMFNPITGRVIDVYHYTIDNTRILRDIDTLPLATIAKWTTGKQSLLDQHLASDSVIPDFGIVAPPQAISTVNTSVKHTPTSVIPTPTVTPTSTTAITPTSVKPTPTFVIPTPTVTPTSTTAITPTVTLTPIPDQALYGPRTSARLAAQRRHAAPAISWLSITPHSHPVGWLPRYIQEAWSDPLWAASQLKEISGLEEKTQWKVVTGLPPGEQALRWVPAYKIKSDGTLKTRLNANGPQQRKGVDYDRIDSPVISWTTMKVMLYMANKKKIPVYKLDAKQAFLQSNKLKKKFYMMPIPGYHDYLPPNSYLELDTAIYGLHQSAREWYLTCSQWLLSEGFYQSKSDDCLFIKKVDDVFIYFGIYVDDDALVCENTVIRQDFVARYSERFDITVDEQPTELLGADIDYDLDNGTLKVSYGSKIRGYLPQWGFGVGECRTTSTPAVPGSKLQARQVDDQPLSAADADNYRSIVGWLIFLKHRVRLDIDNSVRELSMYQEHPQTSHWRAMVHCLRYLSRYPDRGIKFVRNDLPVEADIICYVDSSYAENVDTRRGTSGAAIVAGGASILHYSISQKHVTTSTMESEIAGVASLTPHLEVMKVLMTDDLQLLPADAVFVVREDNKSAIAFMDKEFHSGLKKHIAIKYARSLELLQDHLFRFEFCGTGDMAADVLTKNLGPYLFTQQARRLMNGGAAGDF